MAVLVVPGLLVRVGEDLIGLVDLLELLLCLFIVRIQVRMILPGHLLICALDLVLGCALVNAQDLVIITFFCCHTCCSSQESLKNQESGTGFPVPDSSSLSLLQNGPNGAGNDPRPIGSDPYRFFTSCSGRHHPRPCSQRRNTDRPGHCRPAGRPCRDRPERRPGHPGGWPADRASR